VSGSGESATFRVPTSHLLDYPREFEQHGFPGHRLFTVDDPKLDEAGV
jgi:hypothetical protein